MSERPPQGKRNPYDDRFWRNLLDASEAKTEGAAINEWELDAIRRSDDPYFDEETECICGKQGIVHLYIFANSRNRNRIVVGSCCVRRWQAQIPGWRGKRNYLLMALRMARDSREKEFVKGLLSKCVKYGGRLIISARQARWLEAITGHPWPGRLWENLASKRGGRLTD